MKIGILSDSHKKLGRLSKAIEYLKSLEVEYLIHAGDIVTVEALELLKNSGLPYVCVIGNNDYHLVSIANKYNLHNEPYYFKIKDIKIKLMHHPIYLTPDSDIVIFGHTHIHEVAYKGDTLYINPGEVCARNVNISSCVMLEVTDQLYKLDYFSRVIKSDNWNKESYSYKIKQK